MKLNKKLITIKGHFLLFNAGIAAVFPYLTSFARQLGFSATTVGIIYAVLPIFGLVTKLLLGLITDRFKIPQLTYILFQILIVFTFFGIHWIPQNELAVEFDCGDGVAFLRSCFSSSDRIDTCKVSSLGEETITKCNMNCQMPSLRMWETVCEHWGIPQYCYEHTPNIQYSSNIKNVTVKNKCAYMFVSNVTLDGYNYTPHCRIGGRFGDINRPCSLNCTNQNYSNVIKKEKPFMTCVNENLNYRLCVNDTSSITRLINEEQSSDCEAFCELDPNSPWQLMEICDGWQADAANTCRPRKSNMQQFPSNLSFIATVKLNTMISEHECVFVEVKHINLPDYDTVYYPNCISKAPYEDTVSLFHPKCEISCDNTELHEIFQEAQDDHNDSRLPAKFWLFLLMIGINWTGQVVVITFVDAICNNILGTKVSLFEKQKLWGSIGWGVMVLVSGTLIDLYSNKGASHKHYSVAFNLMFLFMIGDVFVSMFLKVEAIKKPMTILDSLGTVFSSLSSLVFILWTVAIGMCTGLICQFLFWLIEDMYQLSSNDSDHVKTLQGLVIALQTFFSEISIFYFSETILKKLGHFNTMSLILFAFGIRFIIYSILSNPWWVLPIEILQGITYGLFYPIVKSYAAKIAPHGTESTVQALVISVFEGIGTATGSLIGGILYTRYGGWNTFQMFGIGSLCCCFLLIVAQYYLLDKIERNGQKQGYSTVIRYEQPNDMVFMLEEIGENR